MTNPSDHLQHLAYRLFLTFLISTCIAVLAIALALFQASLFDYRFGLVAFGIVVLGLTAGFAFAVRLDAASIRNGAAWVAGSGIATAVLVAILTTLSFGGIATYLAVAIFLAAPFFLCAIGSTVLYTNRDSSSIRSRGIVLAGALVGIFLPALVPGTTGPLVLTWGAGIALSLLAVAVNRRSGTVMLAGVALVLAGLLGFHIAWDFSAPPHWIPDAKDSAKPYYTNAATAAGQSARLVTYWNTFSRTDVVAGEAANGNWKPVYMNGMFAGLAPGGQSGVDNADPLAKRFPLIALPLAAGQPRSILLINSGAGLVSRVAADAEVAVIQNLESSSATKRIMDEWRSVPGGPMGRSALVLDYGETRGRLRRESTQYDQVYLTLPQQSVAWAAPEPADGYLYTREAFRDYWAHLKPGGMLVVLAGGEIPYMRAMLTAWGIANAEGGDVFVRRAWGYRAATLGPASGPYQYMFMLVKGSVPEDLPARVRAVADGMMLVNLFGPGFTPSVANFNIFEQPYYILYHPLGLRIAHQALNDYASKNLQAPADLGPATDMQPFFFEVVRDMHPFLKWLAAACFLLLAYVFLIPLPSERRLDHPAAATRPPLPVHLGYFLALGIATALGGTVLFQQSLLWAGDSGTILNGILAGVVLGAVTGATRLRRNGHHTLEQQWAWMAIAGAVLSVLWSWLVPLWDMSGWPVVFQTVAVAGLAFPVGAFAARLLIPGLQFTAGNLPALVSWAWVTFGAANVLGVVFALWIAQLHGFRTAWMAAAGCYVVALGIGLWLRGSASHTVAPVVNVKRA